VLLEVLLLGSLGSFGQIVVATQLAIQPAHTQTKKATIRLFIYLLVGKKTSVSRLSIRPLIDKPCMQLSCHLVMDILFTNSYGTT
jgi:hypothetical protein